MFCTRESNYRLYQVYERIMSKNYTSSLIDLITILHQKTIYQRCINFLMTEILKYLNGLSPDIMNERCKLKTDYHNLRNFNKSETYIP